MDRNRTIGWKDRIVSPEKAIAPIEDGMTGRARLAQGACAWQIPLIQEGA